LREPGLLSSALEAVAATFGGRLLHQSLFEMAAAYLFYLAQNHPFVDGNKRTALASALTFLLFCVLTLLSVASSFAGISVDHDKSADFSQYRSFTIKEATPAINPLMRERLIKAIEVGLGAKGLEKVDDGADLKVVVHTSTDTEQRILVDNWGYGG